MRPHPFTIIVAVAAILGFVFAAFSTHDFVAHLDRQVHGINCSFLPGITAADASGASGCHTTMMSPYSSVFRQTIWGGLPISLPAMSVFAFLAFAAIALILAKRQADPNATGFLLAGTLLPVAASLAMGYLSLVKLGAACKMCIAIYAASAVVFVFALLLFIRAVRSAKAGVPAGSAERTVAESPPPISFAVLAIAFAVGVAFVLVPAVVYAAAVPDFSRYVGACGRLPHPEDPNHVLISLGGRGDVDAVEVLDPLCPSCKAFEQRFRASDLQDRMRRQALLFPLDNECNWMVPETMHPGACAISEAILCAEDDADEVLAWAFEEQDAIKEAATANPGAAARMAGQRFPQLRRCIGSAVVRAKLNRALRWAVANQLPVTTPQVFVEREGLCAEDTDLGMDYALSRLVRHEAEAER